MRKLFFGLLALAAITTTALTLAQRAREWVEPQTASAAVLHPWTAVGASGTVDETSIPIFGFSFASAGYSSTTPSTNPLEFRYNVTNTFDNNALPNQPGWTTMELGAQAPGTSFVEATLYRVTKCTGATLPICTVRIAGRPTGICEPCSIRPAGLPIDFANYLYSVRVSVDRSTPSEVPLAHTLRIY